ncbi:MAG: arsenite methyltransferase [Nitrospirae bacterium]|nr:arsenite methyltransferase [Nitrospirota bacterium]
MKSTALKDRIRKRYTAAVEAPRQSGCCTPRDGTNPLIAFHSGEDARSYNQAEVAAVGPALVETAFGCGNPVALADLQPGETVLDIGSGAGLDALLAARRVGPTGRVIGLDMTPAMIAAASAHAARAGITNVEFLLGDAEAIPLPDGSVDRVISNCVLNLAPDKARVFREISRVLKPGGRIAISDIVLLRPLPRPLRKSLALWAGCLAGALPEADYVAAAQVARLREVRVVSRIPIEDGVICDALSGGSLPRRLARLTFPLWHQWVSGRAAGIHLQAIKPAAS